MATKQDMTTTLEDTVVGQVTVDAVNEQLIVVRKLATNVSRFSLPTLEEMVVICKAINETSISDVAVNTTLMKAKEGLAMAQEALNMTRLASYVSCFNTLFCESNWVKIGAAVYGHSYMFKGNVD